ncbi:PhnD/SsuA/transferrin family substrate-binding protein [Robbsia sp. Bb-Pol-6]|uniref:PhnD/SsuA/transferrin family substrate-binding protein n=1 Tax=Robbsia betulipollinis TaxID=2981849 RepID=A0ABT3ZJL0_9BURK|nr:PhnD/SsuA/transferrin family substrate-binding protein [Robbsia betulipollinis]MCY0386726.1 PhnD/SsuA/transferrin family substrate-binding protein [Robbsia betulipollinis]
MKEWRIALPMYGITPVARANQRHLLERLTGVLEERGWTETIRIVDPPAPLATHWLDPGLLLSQTCGYPLMTTLRDRVALLATPRYDCEGCAGGEAASRFVVRADAPGDTLVDFRGGVGAVNGMDSNSGMNVFRHALAPLAQGRPFFSKVVLTGGHRASVDNVLAGDADIAAIDPVTWSLLAQDGGGRLMGLRTLGFSTHAPGLPLIGSRLLGEPQRAMVRDALDTLAQREAGLLRTLCIGGFQAANWTDYERILDIERDALRHGTASVFAEGWP